MKKIILTTVAVFALCFANAQEVKFGIKAGLNLSNLTSDVDGNSTKVGFQGGGLVDIKVSEKFSVQPEVLYSLQGTKYDDAGTDIDFTLYYLNIPVMAKYYLADGFSLEAGPQIGFLLSAKAKFYGQTVDLNDVFKPIDFGFNVGVGYDVIDSIVIGARYGFGLYNINDDPEDYSGIRNSNIAVSVGYKF